MQLLVSLGETLVLLRDLMDRLVQHLVVVRYLPLEGLLALDLRSQILASRLQRVHPLLESVLLLDLAPTIIQLRSQRRDLLATDLQHRSQRFYFRSQRGAMIVHHRSPFQIRFATSVFRFLFRSQFRQRCPVILPRVVQPTPLLLQRRF